ncbi:MAG: DNA polymerase I [Pseudomonadota bacterium]
MQKFFVIDFMAMAFRNFHAFGANPLSTSSGFPTSSIYGSAQFILKLIQDEKPDFLVAACDSPEPTFRHEMYDKYKANRSEMPENLSRQIPVLFRLFEAFDIPVMRLPGVEADDIIGSIATQLASKELKVFIVSGDKDFMQLVDDDKVVLYAPKKAGKVEIVNEAGVFQKFGVKPSQVIDVLTLIGDSSDNVPGVPGIGDKGAASLISEFGSLEEIYNNLSKITNKRQQESLRQNRPLADLSKALVTIKNDIPLHFTLEQAVCDQKLAQANPKLLGLMKELEFKTLAAKIEGKLSGTPPRDNTKISEPPLPPKPSESEKWDSSGENDRKEATTKSTTKIAVTPPAESAPTPSHLQNSKYECVTTRNDFKSLLELLNRTECFSFDTETTGLDIHDSIPIGFSFSTKTGQGFYVPFLESHLTKDLTRDEVLTGLTQMFADSKAMKVAHNLKFDLQMLFNIQILPKGPFADTMLQAFVIDSSRSSYGIDALSLEYLGITKIPTSALMGPKKQTSMSEVPLEILTTYASEDADCCFRLYEIFRPTLINKKLTSVYSEIELPLVSILAKMEREGIYVDTEALAAISMTLDRVAKECELKIWDLAGENFNINSPKQLAQIIFEKLKIHEVLGIKKIKKTQSGFSTDVTVMEALSEHPLAEAILEYRTVSKLKNTYVDTLPQLVHPKTSRVHTHFLQTGTATGRLSSSNPNLQNIPIRSSYGKEIRKAFQARNDQWVIMSADYSQIELRILAHLSGDENLKKAFLSGIDIHKATAAFMFAKADPLEVNSDERSRAKAINYGLIYGMGPGRLARDTGVSIPEAKGFIESYFRGFPKIRAYIDGAISFARERGYSETITGRRRTIVGLDDPNGATAAYAKNTAVNSPIQGSAADLIKIAMIKLDKEMEQKNLQAKILLQVHDELVLECPKSEVELILPIVRTAMESAIPMDVPIEVNIGIGQNWLEAH